MEIENENENKNESHRQTEDSHIQSRSFSRERESTSCLSSLRSMTNAQTVANVYTIHLQFLYDEPIFLIFFLCSFACVGLGEISGWIEWKELKFDRKQSKIMHEIECLCRLLLSFLSEWASMYAIYLLTVYSFPFSFCVLEKMTVRYNFFRLNRFDVVSYHIVFTSILDATI